MEKGRLKHGNDPLEDGSGNNLCLTGKNTTMNIHIYQKALLSKNQNASTTTNSKKRSAWISSTRSSTYLTKAKHLCLKTLLACSLMLPSCFKIQTKKWEDYSMSSSKNSKYQKTKSLLSCHPWSKTFSNQRMRCTRPMRWESWARSSTTHTSRLLKDS